MPNQIVSADGSRWRFDCDCEGQFQSRNWPLQSQATARAASHEQEHVDGTPMPSEQDTINLTPDIDWTILWSSTQNDFSAELPLDGRTITDDVNYIRMTSEDDLPEITRVEWYVEGELHRANDLDPPYELEPGNLPVERIEDLLGAGSRTVSALVVYAESGPQTVNATVTVEADDPVPTISNLQVVVGVTSFTVTWNTDFAATSQVAYGLTTSYDDTVTSGTLKTSHSVIVQGLDADTLYHFQVLGQDVWHQTYQSADQQVTTDEVSTDTDPPVMSNLSVTPSSTTALIGVETDEPSIATVEYGLTTSYGNTESTDTLSLTPTPVLTGLTALTDYLFRIKARDESLNESAWDDNNGAGHPFTTEAASSGWPDATNTGPTGTLTPSGTIVTSSNGQVIEDLDITGWVEVQHSNVIIRNCRITGTTFGIRVQSSLSSSVNNLLIEYSEISATAAAAAVLHYGNWTARYCNIHGGSDSVKMYRFCTLEHSWVHGQIKSTGSHNDAIQTQTSGGGVHTIRFNRIEGPWQQSTSAIIANATVGSNSMHVEGNLFSGGSYTTYFENKGTPMTNLTIVDNVWVLDSWTTGPRVLDNVSGTLIWSGNTFSDGSAFPR